MPQVGGGVSETVQDGNAVVVAGHPPAGLPAVLPVPVLGGDVSGGPAVGADPMVRLPAADKPTAGEAPPRLDVAGITGPTRKALDHASAAVLRLAHYNINQLADAAERARKKGTFRDEAALRTALGTNLFRELELSLGRRMSVNVNVASQDELTATAAFWRALPPDQRRALDAAMDAYADAQRGVLPATAQSSVRMEPKP